MLFILKITLVLLELGRQKKSNKHNFTQTLNYKTYTLYIILNKEVLIRQNNTSVI